MMTLASILSLGFFLGMRHASDADHIIAVSTLIAREHSVRQAALRGMFWGIGHTLTLVTVGGAIILFGLVIPERLGLSFEFSVGIMLVLLGVSNLVSFERWINSKKFHRSAETRDFHNHPHSHNDFIHSHPHGHTVTTHGHDWNRVPTVRMDRRLGKFRGYTAVRPVLVGIIHGLAGSAAVALLVLPLITNPVWGILYLAIFGAGTIAGMMLITVGIAMPLALTKKRFSRFYRGLGFASACASVGFGGVMIYQIGFVQGLLLR